ncbi:uncharacterized protein LOC125061028, partial [Pieris napi]|uniref:uncharacterized protein LOC125061028 n=1 Tax=Pieris napi TaxID=78633 RepID=UPI001FB987C6
PLPPTPQKSVTFCAHYNHERRKRTDKRKQIDKHIEQYHSDPEKPQTEIKKKTKDDDVRYYSEPDAKYFEIDYEFLKELRQIARNNCPKCRRRSKKVDNTKRYREKRQKERKRGEENYVLCNGRYHSARQHCRFCCKICNRSTDTLDSYDDEYSFVSKSYSFPSSRTTSSRSRSIPSKFKERKNSIQSNKSVSFLESSNEESMKDEPNYTAKSFTNDLKKFLLKPSSPRLSLREKFMISFKQELEATKKSPKLKAIKGLWKSY